MTTSTQSTLSVISSLLDTHATIISGCDAEGFTNAFIRDEPMVFVISYNGGEV